LPRSTPRPSTQTCSLSHAHEGPNRAGLAPVRHRLRVVAPRPPPHARIRIPGKTPAKCESASNIDPTLIRVQTVEVTLKFLIFFGSHRRPIGPCTRSQQMVSNQEVWRRGNVGSRFTIVTREPNPHARPRSGRMLRRPRSKKPLARIKWRAPRQRSRIPKFKFPHLGSLGRQGWTRRRDWASAALEPPWRGTRTLFVVLLVLFLIQRIEYFNCGP
jgi:hypothetical protein